MHADQIRLSKEIGSNLRAAGDMGFLTDTTVAAADTNAGLIAAVDASVVHAALLPAKPRVDRAIVLGLYDGTLTDANILSLTTLEGAVDLTQAADDVNRNQMIE